MVCTASGFPDSASGKEAAYQCRRRKRHGFDPWIREIPCRRVWPPTPVFLPGESMDRGAWWATVHTVMHNWRDLTCTHIHCLECKVNDSSYSWSCLEVLCIFTMPLQRQPLPSWVGGFPWCQPLVGIFWFAVLGRIFLAVKLSEVCWLLSDVMKGWDTN